MGLFAKKPERPRPAPRDTPFAFEAARDLLGVVRAMWRTAAPESRDRKQLEQAGRTLRDAIKLARASELGSDDYGRAWHLAEQATRQVEAVLLWTARGSIVEAACDAVVPPAPHKRRGRDWRS